MIKPNRDNKSSTIAKFLILKFLSTKKSLNNSFIYFIFLFLISILLRIFCICAIAYVTLVMVHETDSWIPLINFIFCLGILFDLIYFLGRQKEHIG